MKYYLIFGLFLFLTGQSCTPDPGIEKLERINPSRFCDFVRIDQKLSQMDISIRDQIVNLESEYPEFVAIYFDEIMSFDRTKIFDEISAMLSDTAYLSLVDEVNLRFKLLDKKRGEISQALENYQAVFNFKTPSLPRCYFFISGFAIQCFLFEDNRGEALGISLDMFLGDGFPYQKVHPNNPVFSSYLSKSYSPEYLSKKIVEVLIDDKLPDPGKSDFLSLMIWQGKKWYLMDQILNFLPDTIITEFSPEQLSWCSNNQKEMWSFFFEQDLFYESDINKFKKLVSPSPNSPGMPSEAPGQTGSYMGWQIVSALMERNPDISLSEMLRMDGQEILNRSKFKPMR